MFEFIPMEGFLIYPAILVLITLFVFSAYRVITKLLPRQPAKDEKEFDELLSDAGYEYDPSRDIFVTRMNAWQKKYGYCRLYDEACAPMCLILDSEPVYFDYGGKKWLVQFWKGQYYLNTGCELGVYYTNKPEIDIPELFTGNFFKTVKEKDMLEMAFTLYKNGKELFFREERHWWLTGFKTGEFSEPSELTMRIRITFKDSEMCQSFLNAMNRIGYKEEEIATNGITVEFMFDKPHSPQPMTRTEETDYLMQKYNEHCCREFRDIAGQYDTWPEKLQAIREKEPQLYNAVIGVGKTREIFKAFDLLRKHVRL